MDKIHKYEEFVDRRLKPDLANAMAERDKVLEQQKVLRHKYRAQKGLKGFYGYNLTFYSSDLKKNILMLEKNGLTQLRTMVNLGSEVYVQAEVPDTRHIFVEIGLGFHVEFTWSEALQFISTKETVLARKVEDYTEQIAKIKAQIKLVCEGIRELLNLPVDSLRATRKY